MFSRLLKELVNIFHKSCKAFFTLLLIAITACSVTFPEPDYKFVEFPSNNPQNCVPSRIQAAFSQYPQKTAASKPRDQEVIGLRQVALKIGEITKNRPITNCIALLSVEFPVSGEPSISIQQKFSMNIRNQLICLNTNDKNSSAEDNAWWTKFPWRDHKTGKTYPSVERIFLAPCFDTNGNIVEYYDDY